jgi:hypothetical protein
VLARAKYSSRKYVAPISTMINTGSAIVASTIAAPRRRARAAING